MPPRRDIAFEMLAVRRVHRGHPPRPKLAIHAVAVGERLSNPFYGLHMRPNMRRSRCSRQSVGAPVSARPWSPSVRTRCGVGNLVY